MKIMTKGILAVCMSMMMLIGCGGSAENSFTVFTFLGFYPAGTVGCDAAGLTGFAIPISEATNTEVGGFQAIQIVSGGFSNNLSGQAVQVQRVDLDFFIPGADSQPPSAIDAVPVLLGPAPDLGVVGGAAGGGQAGGGQAGGQQGQAGGAVGGGISSSLPPGLQTRPNCATADFTILPSGVRAWMNLNRGSLPPTPFDLFITVSAVGQTSAGDTLYSNQATLPVVVTSDVVIDPTVGSDGEEAGVGADPLASTPEDGFEDEITA